MGSKKIGKEYFDDLTDLFNRRYLISLIPSRLKKVQRDKVSLSILLIDLDHFKNVNDIYGHARGDVVLKEFGLFLKVLLRQDDTVFRYGGDEFICLLSETDYNQAVKISQRFIEQCRVREFSQIRLTMSVGIASSPENARDWQELFDIADRNLYSAKRHGRDRVGVFEPERKGLNIPSGEVVGRDQEINKIEKFINPIFSGRGGAVCISGEAGVGKTRLVREIVKSTKFQDIQFLESNLSATTRSIPYYPFREIIRTIININGGEKSITKMSRAYQIELIKIVPELSDKSKKTDEHIFVLDKFRLFEGVRKFLELQVYKVPLFVSLDNIHWADEGSLELLHYLIRSLKKSPILFFLISRIEEVKESYFQNLLRMMGRENLYEKADIEPLETADVARILSLILDGSPSLELTDYIFKETGGNPFFIEELMKSLETGYALSWDSEKWVFDRGKKVDIPYSVEGVVERKLGMIDDKAVNLLEYASVIGREFDFTFLRDVTRMNEGNLFDLMDEVLDVRLLKGTGRERYRFSKDIIREIIYRQINEIKLKRYHQAIGERLLSLYEGRTGEVVEELSHHFYLSGDREKSIEYSMIAAGRAKDMYANQDAIRFYTWAIECLKYETVVSRELDEIECLRNRSNVLSLTGESEKAVLDLEEAIKKAKELGNKNEEADCLIAFCKIYINRAQYNEALQKGEISLEICRKLNSKKGEVKSLNYIGNIYWHLGKYPRALEFHQQALKLASEIEDYKGEAKSLNNLGIIYDNLGEYSKSLGYYQRSLEVAEENGDRLGKASSLNNIGIVYGNLDKYVKALEFCQRSLRITKEVGDRKGEAASLMNIGVVHHNLGEYSKALEFFKGSLKIAEEIGDRNSEALCLSNIGIIHWYLGEYSKALEFYQSSLKMAEEIGNRMGKALCLSNIGIVHWHLGEYSKALEFYQDSLKIRKEIGDRKGEAASLNNIGVIYSGFGEYSKALEFYHNSLKICEKIGDREGKASSLVNIGAVHCNLGKYPEALKFCQDSLKIREEIGDNQGKVEIFLSFGNALLEMNDLSTAGRYYNKAYSISKEYKSKLLLADVLLGLISFHLKKNNMSKIKNKLNQILSLADELRSKKIKAEALCLSGRFCTKEKKWDKAKSSFKESLSIFKKLKRKSDFAQVHYYQGCMFSEFGDKANA
ncbi:tetratricopeptide repeat protein, partial [candidate division WOR-3 bacterium]|nr:tetratricopeptide repeat protein [candidate division WOR-3 bacterium]